MTTPILRIPIDDAAAQRYFAAFKKYTEEVKNQGDVWKDSNDTLGLMAATMAGVAAEIAHQAEESRKLSEEEKKREEAQKKAAKEKADADKAEANREKEAAARRQHAIDQVKEYSRSVADAAVNLGKWALIGEGAALAAGALSLWGLDKFVAGVGEERRLSQGLGVSMGQRQGLGLNMQRYFDVNSVLETVANAQGSPAQWGTFAMMGVNPNGKSTAQLTGELALAARRMFINDRGNLGLASAQGLTNVFSPDDLRRLAATPEKDLRQSLAQSDKLAATSGLRDEVGRKWQDFLINLDTAGLKLKNALIDKLTALENNGTLDKLIQKFGALALDVLDKVDFAALGKGLESLDKYIGSGEFQNNFKTFIDDVGAVASKMEALLLSLGVLPNNSGGPAPAGVPNAGTQNVPGFPFLGVFNGPGSGNYDLAAQKYARQEMLKWGWTPDQAQGLISNLNSESQFNPFAKGDKNAKTGQYDAYGIGQWHADRQANYAALFGHAMQSVKDPATALREQLEFMQWELTSNDKRNHFKQAGDDLKKTRGAFAAGFEVSNEYEKPKGGLMAATARGVNAVVSVTVQLQPKPTPSTPRVVNSAAGG